MGEVLYAGDVGLDFQARGILAPPPKKNPPKKGFLEALGAGHVRGRALRGALPAKQNWSPYSQLKLQTATMQDVRVRYFGENQRVERLRAPCPDCLRTA